MNLVFLGPPGAGKGTVAAKVQETLSIPHISTGDIFRAAIKNQTELGKKVKSIIDSGELVPDELTIALVEERLGEEDAQKGYILDGFPRTTPQADALLSFSKLDATLLFEISEEEVVRRLSGRRTCKNCGATYHVEFMPPKQEGVCDECGGELYIRDDDKEESIKNRLKVYHKQTAPLVEYFKDKGLLVTVDASSAPDEVLESVVRKLKSL